MAEPTPEGELLTELLETGDPSVVPLSEVVAVAEAIVEGGHEPRVLIELVDRALPRLVKKERVEEIEGLWLVCVTIDEPPVATMLTALERLAPRGKTDLASELAAMLVEALSTAGAHEQALEVSERMIGLAPAKPLVNAVGAALSEAYSGVESSDSIIEAFAAAVEADPCEAMHRAVRALTSPPGSFIEFLPDHMVGQVVSNDGDVVTMRHPSGTTEKRPIGAGTPPMVLSARDFEVRRLFEPDAYRADWDERPTEVLLHLLEERGGTLSIMALGVRLTTLFRDEEKVEAMLIPLKKACSAEDESLPAYHSARRLFAAPGAELPRKTTKARAPRKPKAEKKPTATSSRAATSRSDEYLKTTLDVRWVDLSTQPEIRVLRTQLENDIVTLTTELNVDLPMRLEEARAHGDLSENAEYDAAKERLVLVQARIEQLRGRLGQLHELSRVRLVPGFITVMSEITVADEASGAERRLRIVPNDMPAPLEGDVSAGTPYGRVLMGKEAGDTVVVKLPRRTERLEVVKVVDPA